MVNTNAEAMGIIFPNSYDKLVPEMVNERLIASIPFGSRYRLIDFLLSSMVGSGVNNIGILARENYMSLVDHIGTGREWDLSRKNGGLNIFPPFSRKNMGRYDGRIDGLYSILSFLKKQKEKYVILSDANLVMNFDFKAMLKFHIESGADVTIAYAKEVLPEDFINIRDGSKAMYYTLKLDDDLVKNIYINMPQVGVQNCCMNIYIVEREWLIKKVNAAFMRGGVDFERDILIPYLESCKIMAYEYTGYLARITGLKSYFNESMRLLDNGNLETLFKGNPIYTKIRDDNPTRYIGDVKVENVMVADGCTIEGEVENCILFRGVKIAKGAKVKNCILMQDTVVQEGASLEYVITDKNVTITDGKELKGNAFFPVYVPKKQVM